MKRFRLHGLSLAKISVAILCLLTYFALGSRVNSDVVQPSHEKTCPPQGTPSSLYIEKASATPFFSVMASVQRDFTKVTLWGQYRDMPNSKILTVVNDLTDEEQEKMLEDWEKPFEFPVLRNVQKETDVLGKWFILCVHRRIEKPQLGSLKSDGAICHYCSLQSPCNRTNPADSCSKPFLTMTTLKSSPTDPSWIALVFSNSELPVADWMEVSSTLIDHSYNPERFVVTRRDRLHDRNTTVANISEIELCHKYELHYVVSAYLHGLGLVGLYPRQSIQLTDSVGTSCRPPAPKSVGFASNVWEKGNVWFRYFNNGQPTFIPGPRPEYNGGSIGR